MKTREISTQNQTCLSGRQVKLQGRIVTYKTILSSRAKYLRLQINHANELEVILPKRYKHDKAEDFILQKKKWILKHLKERQNNSFFYFGKEIKVQINYDLFVKKPQIIHSNKKLIANIPAGYSFTQEEIYDFWLRHKAKIYIPKREFDVYLIFV